jgi:mono/diheme cytochrome c family protein
MTRGFIYVVCSVAFLGAGLPLSRAQNLPSARAVVEEYCIACHNAQAQVAGFVLNPAQMDRIGDDPAVWEKVARKLRTREMPPPGLPRPAASAYEAATAEVEAALDAAAAAKPKPGRVAVHRLNRAEYVTAVRDLLALEVDAKSLLPADDAAQEGFENVAAVLTLSPALLENYLSAARTISRLAVGDPTINPGFDSFKISKTLFQDGIQMSDDLPFGSQGGIAIPYFFPVDGEYTIKVLLRRQEYDYIMGLGEPQQLDIRLDGVLLERFKVGGEAKGQTMPESYAGNTQGSPEFEEYMHTADANLEVRIPVSAGEHTVGVSFVRRFWEPEGVLQPPITGFGRSTNELYHGYPAVEIVNIGGPFGSAEPGDSSSRRKIFVCTPTKRAEEEPCARKILSALASRAYRRPVTKPETETLLDFYRAGRKGQTFDEGVRLGIERILAAPSFLFRVHRQPAGLQPGSVYALSDLDLAARLSFFLWSSIPDEELLGAAARGDLHDPAQLERQVLRMFRDPRSQALVDNFAVRWLELNKLAGIAPDALAYPEFDENLREAMKQETTLFVSSQLREDRRVTDLLTADYSYLNERLAKHYGIPNVYGNHFRRVTFDDGVRGGLLTNASILSVTSYPTRTSVVMRGKWLLSNILGAPPPAAPPDVPALEDAGAAGQPRSLRERMELHRKNPVCASCHQRMDPLGFALENFDALGKWRSESDGAPIDAGSSLPNGASFSGADGLRKLLGEQEEDFVRTLTEKLLAYAIGRGVDYHDLPAVRQVVRDAAPSNYRWSAIILGIVKSTPFRMGSVEDESSPQLARNTDQ